VHVRQFKVKSNVANRRLPEKHAATLAARTDRFTAGRPGRGEAARMMRILYGLMRLSYDRLYGEQQMLHYPLHRDATETLFEGQTHLTDYCLSHVPDLSQKRLLDIGCGNGIQTLHIHERYNPEYLYAVDLNRMHIGLAKKELVKRRLARVDFAVDNAQSLTSVADNSFDAAICIESSHHYPDKDAFLHHVQRVLRPGGYFVLADLIRKDHRQPSLAEKKMFLFHWCPQRYRDALRRVGMVVVKEEDITDSILPAFRLADRWLKKPSGVSPAAHVIGRWLGRAMIAFYRVQLERYLRYHLFLARKE
jgi:2-polyprenyl-3-methyl-5-hydroxy-6-metoxy-1,4-benzoquinol methylase